MAVLASGEGFADALAAAPLAAFYDAPILLTGRHEVTNSLHADYQATASPG